MTTQDKITIIFGIVLNAAVAGIVFFASTSYIA